MRAEGLRCKADQLEPCEIRCAGQRSTNFHHFLIFRMAKQLSNGTLALKFMQRKALSNGTAESGAVATPIELKRAAIVDDAAWDVGEAVRASWGIPKNGGSR